MSTSERRVPVINLVELTFKDLYTIDEKTRNFRELTYAEYNDIDWLADEFEKKTIYK